MSDQLPLTPAQQQTARELPWYRQWLIATCDHPGIQDTGEGLVYCIRCAWRSGGEA
jgi:hypothetical protein